MENSEATSCSAREFLPKFAEARNYREFRGVCVGIFESAEVEEDRIREIFRIFARSSERGDRIEGEGLVVFNKWLSAVLRPVNVLIIVDFQNDFIDGTLALRNSELGQDPLDFVEPINNLIKNGRWDKVIYTLDFHPENHISFFENLHLRELHESSKVKKEDAKVFDTVIFAEPFLEQKLWPKHCVRDSWGAELHNKLFIAPSSLQIKKGEDPDKEAYSAFATPELHELLSQLKATHLFICGLAYDVCVKATCLDGLALGYPVAFIEDCSPAFDFENSRIARNLICESDGFATTTEKALSFVNGGKSSLTMSHRLAKGVGIIN